MFRVAANVSLQVCLVVAVLAVFPVTAGAQTTALFFESQAGDYIGAGQTRTYAPTDATFQAGPSFDQGASFWIQATNLSFWWRLTLVATGGAPLTVGSYTGAKRFPFTAGHALEFAGSGRGCSRATGRFDILEISVAPDGSVVRFAADFEQHCEDADPGLFGAIRYNSTISDLRPFQGNYPRHSLTTTAHAHGRVTGSGLDCGSGNTMCEVVGVAPSSATITAIPEAGYLFTGWSGDCEGNSATATLRVNGVKRCDAFFEPQVTTAPRTLLYWDSEPGDVIGLGVDAIYSPPNSVWQVTASPPLDRVTVNVKSGWSSWSITMSGRPGVALAPGYYEAAGDDLFRPFPGLVVSGSGNSCDSTGRFIIYELVANANGTVAQLAADFEIHCQNANPGLFGAIRYNSTVDEVVPFDGAYPIYQLTVLPHAHGLVTGAGLNCGSGNSVCQLTQATAGMVTLTATPETGYLFAGWTGDCGTASTTVTIRLNGPKVCDALFEPQNPLASRTLLYWDSEAGDPIGQGIDAVYSSSNSVWNVLMSSALDGVHVHIQTGTHDVRIALSGPSGVALTPGYYAAARNGQTPFNRIDVSAFSGGCSQETGRFVIHELVTNPNGSVARLAADFEQHCGDADPGLVGAIRYNSTIGGIPPFDGNYPRYELTVAPHAHGRVTGTGLDCGSSGTLCQTVLGAPATLTLTATPDAGYVFAGWTATNCEGSATVTVRVNTVKTCSALFEPLVTTSARSFLFIDNPVNDGLGGRRKLAYTPANSVWSVRASSSGDEVDVSVRSQATDWYVRFSAPYGQSLAPGYYGAARYDLLHAFNGLSTVGGCYELTGRFVILEYVPGPNNTVQRFAADFEAHCNDEPVGSFAAIRYNSTISTVFPFANAYPAYQLTLGTPMHGRIAGQGLSCGGGNTQCQLALSGPARITLTATPDFGYLFAGWTEDCSGATSTTVHVNGPKRCAALFEPIAAVAPRTLIRIDRTADSNLPAGWSRVLSSGNSRWTASAFGTSNSSTRVGIDIYSVGEVSIDQWDLTFEPPSGEFLQVGRRYTIQGSSTSGQARWSVFGDDIPYCSTSATEFTVRELVIGPQSVLLRFAVDFAQTCSSGGATLTGSLQYNSTIDVPQTTIAVEPAALRFASVHNGTTITHSPAPQALRLAVNRPDVGWTATANQSWIKITPASGTGPAALTVEANLLGGHPGTGTATGLITVTLTDGSGTAKTVDLTVTLHRVGSTTYAFGNVDTPLPDRTGVTGAVPITGWALDDVEIASVSICRAAVAGESAPADVKCGGNAQLFVGDAVFIEGARPDVQTAYSSYPRADAAGWGFLLLTNTLPNQGNGTFTFYVYARDREGHIVLLGARTMTCDNAHATVPFGTIDTPLQGETVNGASYVNFGWALTQNPKSLPIDGSTLMVYVDGVPVGNPSYNHYRPDIATIFPGFANSNGAIGFKIIDTTALANGLHTIVWTATDSAGATAGLGSRFFRVLNGAGSSVTATEVSAAITAVPSVQTLDSLPFEATPLVGRRTWSPAAPWTQYGANRTGRAVMRGEELDRFELALGANARDRSHGYLRVGDQLRPLPAGSRLDGPTGRFTWSPGVGFVGTYDIVFMRTRSDGTATRREVRFILQPKGSGHVGTQVVIDTPRAQQDLVQPFSLGGWAVDLDAASGVGIEALHVWAYPSTGGTPIFVVATAPSAARLDVAAVHGDQFRESGFGLAVQGLPAGTYDLAVFPWSSVIGAFAPPQTVRITVQ